MGVSPRFRRCADGERAGSLRVADQSGSALITVFVFMLVGIVTVAAVMSLVYGALTSTRAFRSRTDSVQSANSAIDLALTRIRSDPSRGVEGSTENVTYGGYSVSCVPEAGSGEVQSDRVADRYVNCSATRDGNERVRVRVRFVDKGGNTPGAEVKILDRVVND